MHRFVRTLPVLLFATFAAPLSGAPSGIADSPADADASWPPPKVAPFLSPEEAIKTIHIAPGFHLELVAAEPMVQHPVTMSWDPDGRLWVAEMRSYMPDVNATGENAPTGRISVLEDTDGDGRMDKSTVFLNHLVLPRAVSFVRGGVLVATPPNLYFCQDTDGDLKCDTKTLVAKDYGITGNPEHQPNGIMPALDNWIYSANYDKRLRYVNNAWLSETLPELGQWGITQDNFGRLFHDSNTDQLRGSLFPPHYADRNPHYHPAGANEQIAKDQTVFPLHATAVDRGYVRSLMRDDGTIHYFTAACAPCVYRGGLYPSDFDGNAFVCEPAGNLIKRNLLAENEGAVTASNAYPDKEFLASDYERFRPVNLFNAPDGCLYVVDMHHGLLQHKTYLTTYCETQYLARQLQTHLQTGRIYRIVPDGTKPFPRPHLSNAATADLLAALSHPNGWWRDTAQRLLVERDDHRAVAPLKKVATTSANPLARLHALWTLEGLHAANADILTPLLSDADPHVRAAAVRVSETLLNSASRPKIQPVVLKLAGDSDPAVQLQLALSLTPLGIPETDALVASLVTRSADNALLRDAVLTGLRGRELEFLSRLLTSGEWSADAPGRAATLTALARCILIEGSPGHVADLLRLIPTQTGWRQVALLEGLRPPGAPKRKKNAPPAAHPVMLAGEPTEFLTLRANAKYADQLDDILAVVHWPGQPGYTPPPPPKPLTREEQALFEHGRGVYTAVCAACHKPTGLGQEGLAPPLVDSEWVLGPQSRLIRIVLNGLTGPVTVGGKSYALDMPNLQRLPDEDLAAALTYVRRSWDHTASAVRPEAVKKVRATSRPTSWTERELLKVR